MNYPNPSDDGFTLKDESVNTDEVLQIKIFDDNSTLIKTLDIRNGDFIHSFYQKWHLLFTY
jgi:hypothetical protein